MNLSAFQYNRRVLLAIVIAVPLVIAVVFYLVSLELSADQERALQAIRQTHEEQRRTNELDRTLHVAESSVRGYLLTADSRLLTPFYYARIQGLLLLPYLERLMAGNLLQSQRLVELRMLIHRQFTGLQEVIDLLKANRQGEALRRYNANAGDTVMRHIRTTLHLIGQEETTLLTARRKTNGNKMAVRENLFTILLFLAAGVVAGAGVLMLRIQQLHSIITICAWTQRVNYHGRWMRMEEFLWERFRIKVSHGISEEAFDGVMGIVGKNITVSDHRGDRATEVKHDDGRQPTRWG